MKIRLGITFPFIVFTAASIAATAVAQTPKDSSKAKAVPAVGVLIDQLKGNNKLIPKELRGLTAQSCPGDCTVTIKMSTYNATINGKPVELCVAALPVEVKFPNTASGNPEKTITWTLDSKTVGGAPLEFLERGGITKLTDKETQFNPNNKRTDEYNYGGKNAHKKTGEAHYIPIIYRWLPAGPQVCGTADDPKIVNY